MLTRISRVRVFRDGCLADELSSVLQDGLPYRDFVLQAGCVSTYPTVGYIGSSWIWFHGTSFFGGFITLLAT